ncbi:MAG: hypothetical protein GH151_03700 [Bacteroidetes bacterium]|nr:hypothetical protein [Bacteroidota bacterium]
MPIIKIILDAISPNIRELLVNFVLSLSVEAAKTPNPWDDILVSILRILLDIRD